jgi:hypothetical protein
MLAYVFVHRPAGGIERRQYVSRLLAFHDALAKRPPAGFVESWVWELVVEGLNGAFEDWYLVEDWAALGALNGSAVSAQRKAPHDRIAVLAGEAAGAVYELAHGVPRADMCFRTRVAKPVGVPYELFEARLRKVAGADGVIWKRQMVLGPDREFLVDTPARPGAGALDVDRPVDVVSLRAVRPEQPARRSAAPESITRDRAIQVLDRLHQAQNQYYRGGSGGLLRELRAPGIVWTVPGDSRISGIYRGLDEVFGYFSLRRELAEATFQMHRRDVLVGEHRRVAALTDGTAEIGGENHHWSTVGLYELDDRDRIAACWLLALDQRSFDASWSR